MRLTFASQLAALLCCGMAAIPQLVHAQEACAKDYEQAVQNISAQTDPELNSTADQIKKLQGIGDDPNRYIVDFEGKQVPITVKFYALANRKSEAIQKEQDTAKSCASSVMPLRTASDLAIIYETAGLSLLLPPEATRIDWAEILKNGKPLGGDSALIPKARDDMLNAIGLDNNARPLSLVL